MREMTKIELAEFAHDFGDSIGESLEAVLEQEGLKLNNADALDVWMHVTALVMASAIDAPELHEKVLGMGEAVVLMRSMQAMICDGITSEELEEKYIQYMTEHHPEKKISIVRLDKSPS